MLKKLFFGLIVRPFLLLISGVHVRGREHLNRLGPCIIAANHNSHLDTPVLMSLFPLSQIGGVRPLASAEYFLKTPWRAWFSQKVIGIIVLKRAAGADPLEGAKAALRRGERVIIYPEGSRGAPEKLAPFKSGVAHLAKAFPDLPVVPVYIHGAGKSLPRGEGLFVPFIIEVCIAAPLRYEDTSCAAFTARLQAQIKALEPEGEDYE